LAAFGAAAESAEVLSQPASVALAGRAFRAENALGSPADAGIP
jgi:hypothetical protein